MNLNGHCEACPHGRYLSVNVDVSQYWFVCVCYLLQCHRPGGVFIRTLGKNCCMFHCCPLSLIFIHSLVGLMLLSIRGENLNNKTGK